MFFLFVVVLSLSILLSLYLFRVLDTRFFRLVHVHDFASGAFGWAQREPSLRVGVRERMRSLPPVVGEETNSGSC